MAADCREALGENRLAWLRSLPLSYNAGPVALVHASPVSLWRAPGHTASDKELEAAYGPLGQPVAAYGHTHVPYIRAMGSLTVANCGSAGLPYDGDRRASYLLVDGETPCIRRVEYDVDREVRALGAGGRPQAEWVARMLQAARPQLLSVAG
jgi:diadenosine tetraphosphatase ApaH/serine/threonine PP2A family protein phosphatase